MGIVWEWNFAGFNQLRKSDEVTEALKTEALAVASRAAQMSGLTFGFDDDAVDFVVRTPRKRSGSRVRFFVAAQSDAAQAAEARNGVLTKALNG